MGLPTPSASEASATTATTTQPDSQQKAALADTYNQAAQSSTQATRSSMPNMNPATAGTPASSLPPEAIELATKLFDFARAGDTAALTQYVAAGIPPNLTNGTGDTLLMLAAYHGHADTVAELLQRGADPNVLNEKGQSPLAGAVFKGYEPVVRTLVEQGSADVHAGQPSAVDCARMFKRADMLTLFGIQDAT